MKNIPESIKKQASKFAPEVRLHPDDIYRPASAEWYLARTHLRFDHRNYRDCQILAKGQVNATSLVEQSHKVSRGPWGHSGNRQYSGIGNNVSRFFLQIPNDHQEKETRRGEYGHFMNGRVTSHVPCYYHIRNVSEGTNWWDYQYMFFYPYNGNLGAGGAHESDWEHVTVRVDLGTSNPIKGVFFAAHGSEGRWATKQTRASGFTDRNFYRLNAENRPVVYSAKHSHASYPFASIKKRGGRVDVFLPDDETMEGGPIWDCSRNLIYLGERERPETGREWIKFTGRWGEIGWTRLPWVSNLAFSGTESPSLKAWWDHGEPDGPLPPGGIQIFEHSNWRGHAAKLHNSVADLRKLGFENNISAIKRFDSFRAVAYEKKDFKGRSLYVHYDMDIGHLKRMGFNDKISSIKVFNRNLPGITVFEHPNQKGKSTFVSQNISDLRALGMNDNISSLSVLSGSRAILYEHQNYKGKSVVVSHNVSNVRTVGMNDRVSSIKII